MMVRPNNCLDIVATLGYHYSRFKTPRPACDADRGKLTATTGDRTMSDSDFTTPNKPKARKLTACEQRAVQWCESIKQGSREHFTIEWKKSRTWGYNPRIAYGNDNIVNISGCGYCKKSAALASALCWLFNPDTEKEAHNDIAGRAGCGERSVIDALEAHGWTLQCITGTDTTDVYRITRSEGL